MNYNHFNKSDFYKIISVVINGYMPSVINFLEFKEYDEFNYQIINNNMNFFKFLSMSIYNDLSKIIDYNTKIYIYDTYENSGLEEDLVNTAITPAEIIDFHLYQYLEQTILKIIERNIAYYFNNDKNFYPSLFLDTNGRIMNKIKNVSLSFSKYPALIVQSEKGGQK
jgi:hypothetical protein